jgi:hypothetical protein
LRRAERLRVRLHRGACGLHHRSTLDPCYIFVRHQICYLHTCGRSSNLLFSSVTCFFLSTKRALFVYFLIQSNVGSSTGSRDFFLFPRSVVFIFAQVCAQIHSTPLYLVIAMGWASTIGVSLNFVLVPSDLVCPASYHSCYLLRRD